MISQATTGNTIWIKTWEICLNTMLDIGLLSLATKRKGQIHSGRSQCYTIQLVMQASKSMYCQYGPELLIGYPLFKLPIQPRIAKMVLIFLSYFCVTWCSSMLLDEFFDKFFDNFF